MQANRVTDWQGKMLGQYRLGRLLGRGGMGEVWQAEDTELHRQVAAKLLPSVVANETNYLRAFAEEARTAASLEHPHILPVHDFGEEPSEGDIITYLIMPLITGGSLRDRLPGTQDLLPVEASLHYLLQAAQAIDYAHSRHVLHRDIKPANMLLQQDWLFLADFGIAKLLSSETHRSHTHAGAGTPDYMAPEQVQGKAEAASDRYSLAVIAYQLFSGHKPFSGSDPYEILIKQIQDVPPSPRQFNPQMPHAVEITLLKGLAKRPEARPSSCSAFVEELRYGWRTGTLPSSRSDPDATQLAPWSKRSIANQPTILASPPTTPPTAETEQPYSAASRDAVLMERSTLPPVSTTAEATTQVVDTPAVPQKIGRRELLIGGAAAAVTVAGGTGLVAYLRSRATPPAAIPGPHKLIAGVPVLQLSAHTDAVWSVVWHPSGRYLTTAGADTHVMLWDVESSLQKSKTTIQQMTRPLHDWKFKDPIAADWMSWSADGRTLAVTVPPETNVIYLITDQQSTPALYTDKGPPDKHHIPPAEKTYYFPAWSPIDNLLAVSVVVEMDVELWQRGNTSGPIRTLSGPPQPPDVYGYPVYGADLAWSHDGTLLAGVRDDFKITVWDVKTGKMLPTLTLPDRSKALTPGSLPPNVGRNPITVSRRSAITWSPYVRNQLVTNDLDVATVWDAQEKKLLRILGTNDPAALTPISLSDRTKAPTLVNGLSWSPNGRYIAGSFEHSHQVYIWDTQNKAPKITHEGFQIQDLRFGAENGHKGQGQDVPSLLGNPSLAVEKANTIIDLAWSPDGRYLATASNDTTVIIWRVDGA